MIQTMAVIPPRFWEGGTPRKSGEVPHTHHGFDVIHPFKGSRTEQLAPSCWHYSGRFWKLWGRGLTRRNRGWGLGFERRTWPLYFLFTLSDLCHMLPPPERERYKRFNGYEPKPLKLWTKINPLFCKLYVCGILSQQQNPAATPTPCLAGTYTLLWGLNLTLHKMAGSKSLFRY